MDILFINPGCNSSLIAGELKDFYLPMPPISLAYLAGYLENKNISVQIYDDSLNNSNNVKLLKYLKSQPVPLLIGLPTFSSTIIYRVEEIIKIIRQIFPKTKIILGNTHANLYKNEIIASGLADFVALGEAEETLLELIQQLKSEKNEFTKIKGLVFKDSQNRLIETAPREPIQLETLPFPAWHLLPLKKYRLFLFGRIKEPILFIVGSRGCPFQCTFCCSAIIQKGIRRTRSAKNIVDEMEYFHKKYGIKQFNFIDALFPISPAEGINFCQEIIKRNLQNKFIWATETRADTVNEELIKIMAQAGCKRIFFGIEFSSQENIEKTHKNINLQKVTDLIALCKKARIETLGYFILGIPDENQQDIVNTINLAVNSELDFAKFSVFTPYPGSQIYNQLLAEGKLVDKFVKNWDGYTMHPSAKNTSIYINENVPPKALTKYQKIAYLKFYFKPKRIIKLIKYLNLNDCLSLIRFIFKEILLGIIKK